MNSIDQWADAHTFLFFCYLTVAYVIIGFFGTGFAYRFLGRMIRRIIGQRMDSATLCWGIIAWPIFTVIILCVATAHFVNHVFGTTTKTGMQRFYAWANRENLPPKKDIKA